MKQALEGIKVLDLTRVLAGPYATMVMADMGAEVIKIETPKIGDDSRHFGPYINHESAYFMSLNRNKKSMTLNLKKEKAKELFLEMVKHADVIVENYRPGTMEKLGLGYEELKKINPRIIYAAASGFGHSGPYSKRAAYDAVVQAMGGIMSITGEVGGVPTRVGPSIGDITAGLFSAIGILAALNYRNETGIGQKVDVAMLDCQVAILENAIARYVVTGEVPKPAGNRHTSITPFEPFETLDGEIMIAAGNDVLFQKMCNVMNQNSWLEDERFMTNPSRTKHADELKELIEEVTKTKNTEQWQNILDEAGVPNGPINTIDKVLEDPQVKAREMIVEVDHPVAGHLKMAGVPIKMSETQGKVVNPAPLLGEHTHEVIKELLGYSDEEIKLLEEEGIF
ncbi:CoA:oxalate CoA-transferase [Acetoanaerobium pronyense]|uniref:CoA:oxalate CoA-transferase n=1 Tax=Acetoanaerobium pronyense TaxID=1482736 RepID=A0ABS4KKN7_9FIRM|nr:CoA transferase [Acetoanaerobium pronyense]MBP2028353.1 CoA:oxalate CoA-transferase [Acetoanaerobium pronyense]